MTRFLSLFLADPRNRPDHPVDARARRALNRLTRRWRRSPGKWRAKARRRSTRAPRFGPQARHEPARRARHASIARLRRRRPEAKRKDAGAYRRLVPPLHAACGPRRAGRRHARRQRRGASFWRRGETSRRNRGPAAKPGLLREAALASTPEAAWALARYGAADLDAHPAAMLATKKNARRLGDLPLAALRLDAATIKPISQRRACAGSATS